MSVAAGRGATAGGMVCLPRQGTGLVGWRGGAFALRKVGGAAEALRRWAA